MLATISRPVTRGMACFVLTASLFVVAKAADAPSAVADHHGTWAKAHPAVGGPMLDPAWFAHRRVVVYLVPEGGETPALRKAAGAIMQDRWTEGDWSLKHVIISDVGRVRFAVRQRAAIHDIALRVTAEAGQDESFVTENEEFIQQHVFFVRDPERSLWRELLGSADPSNQCKILLLDYGGRVVKTIDPAIELPATADASIGSGAAAFAAEVRRLLPARPELDG